VDEASLRLARRTGGWAFVLNQLVILQRKRCSPLLGLPIYVDGWSFVESSFAGLRLSISGRGSTATTVLSGVRILSAPDADGDFDLERAAQQVGEATPPVSLPRTAARTGPSMPAAIVRQQCRPSPTRERDTRHSSPTSSPPPCGSVSGRRNRPAWMSRRCADCASNFTPPRSPLSPILHRCGLAQTVRRFMHGAPPRRNSRSWWDHEFESAFLQRRVNNELCSCRGRRLQGRTVGWSHRRSRPPSGLRRGKWRTGGAAHCANR
jgi:hypothetical protein